MIRLIKNAFHREAETKRALADFILQTTQLSMGGECKKFEETFARKQGRKYAVFVNSGSSANLLLIQSLLNIGTLKKGDRVGFSALTWATNVMPIIELGLIPVPVDCEVSTLNVSPRTLQEKVDDIRALFITNALGFSDKILEIKRMCEKRNILFLEDNCEALGSVVAGELLGNFGFASTFSFFVGHHLSTIEGGMVCTDEEALYNALLMARSHGWDRNLPEKKQKEIREENHVDGFYNLYTFYDLGYNLRPTEINGFLGNNQMPYWDDIVSARAKNFFAFSAAATENESVFPLEVSHMEIVSNFAMPLVFKTSEDCEKQKKSFIGAGVEIRPIISGDMTRQPFYQKYTNERIACPGANIVHQRGFYFGNNQDLTQEEVSDLCKLIRGK